MQPTANYRSAMDSSCCTTAADGNNTGTRTHPAAEIKGYIHLLQGHTLDAIMSRPCDVFQVANVRTFLVDGVLPSDEDDLDYLALWTVRNRQGGVLNALLGITPLVVSINDADTASGLLGATQAGMSFSGLTLQLDTTMRQEVLDVVIPLLAQAMAANPSLTAIVLFSNDYRLRGLQPLFDVLAGVKKLELVTVEEQLHSDDVNMIATLLSKNKNLRALELNNLDTEQASCATSACVSAGMSKLFQHLEGQWQLERLVLSAVSHECQSPLGNFLGSSHTLDTLQISIDGSVATAALVDGFRQNRSIERLYLNLTDLADGMLPLLSAIAENKSSLRLVALTTCHGRADAKDSQYIGDLIGCNDTLASLVWKFSNEREVDFAHLGSALEKNRRLESLCLIREREHGDRHVAVGQDGEWVDADAIPSFIKKLGKNRTLTKLRILDSVRLANAVPQKFPMLQQVLDRNLAWQKFACSDAFISGAVQGFFTTLGMPADTAFVTAGILLQQRPRVATRALALVNRAAYDSALAGRRHAHPAMLNESLAAMPDSDEESEDDVFEFMAGATTSREGGDNEDMIALLNGVVLSRADYSVDDLRRIAHGPALGAALVVIMARSAAHYLYLVKQFCQAIGTDVMRSKILAQFSNPLYVSKQQLQMLEQSFDPDLQHLARFVVKDLDYHSIDSHLTRFFVGYNVRSKFTLPPVRTAIKSWCVKNKQPGVLMALHDSGRNSHFQFNTRELPVGIRRGVIRKIPLLQHVSSLGITGLLRREDALDLRRVLAAEFGLVHLEIGGCCRGPDFDLVMNGLKDNKGIETVNIARIVFARGLTLCGTLAAVLQANSRIRTLKLYLNVLDPELADFERLSVADPRLVLKIDE